MHNINCSAGTHLKRVVLDPDLIATHITCLHQWRAVGVRANALSKNVFIKVYGSQNVHTNTRSLFFVSHLSVIPSCC